LYLKNKYETPKNKALLMHAYGMAAEEQIESATTKQQIHDELGVMWDRLKKEEDWGVDDCSEQSREPGPDDVSINGFPII